MAGDSREEIQCKNAEPKIITTIPLNAKSGNQHNSESVGSSAHSSKEAQKKEEEEEEGANQQQPQQHKGRHPRC